MAHANMDDWIKQGVANGNSHHSQQFINIIKQMESDLKELEVRIDEIQKERDEFEDKYNQLYDLLEDFSKDLARVGIIN